MIGRAAALVYGLVSYLIFSLSFAYTPAFLGNYPRRRSRSTSDRTALRLTPILIDAILLGLFAIQHSVMARPAFKRWWTRIIPASCERSTYVLISSALLILIFWQWRPIAATVWHVEGWPAAMFTAIFWIGWLIALLSTFHDRSFRAVRRAPGRSTRCAAPPIARRRSRRRCCTDSCVTR